MKEKILVTGATGQLGHDVCKELERRGIEHRGVSSKDFDVTHREAVQAYVKEYQPTAIIHCGAYTAVDKAEDEKEKCFAVNGEGTGNLAEICKEMDAKMVYISTDYVFQGEGATPYEVEDTTNPQGIYGASKLQGEEAVRKLLEKYFIVRISWVFGENGNNFVKTMLRIGKDREEVTVVADQVGSPTYTADLAPLLCDMVMSEKYGTYHATNEGYCSWAEFAEEIFKIAGYTTKVKHITTAEYPVKAKRPANSKLSKTSLDEAGFTRLPQWKDAIGRYVKLLV